MKFAVIGDPIEHSRSPEMHLPVLQKVDPEAVYEKVQIKKGGLAAWIEKVKAERYKGFNITMPHKADILPLLDGLDEEAALFRSVNTVVNRNGKLYGYNTDAGGFLLSLTESGNALKDRKILLLGAGGAARTIALKTLLEGAKAITILARRPEQTETLCTELREIAARSSSRGCDDAIKGGALQDIAQYAGENPDIVVNATPLGMAGTEAAFSDLTFLKKLPEHTLVYDLIYEPAETALLAEAKRTGHKTQNGLKMLEYQALLADLLFLDRETDPDAMRLTNKKNTLERAVAEK